MGQRRAEELKKIASKLHRIAAAIDEDADAEMASGEKWDDPAVSRTDQEDASTQVPESAVNPKEEAELIGLIDGDGAAIADEPSPAKGMNKGLSQDNRFRKLKKDTFSSRSSDGGAA